MKNATPKGLNRERIDVLEDIMGAVSGAIPAVNISYDNTSGLTSTNVQDAIDEVEAKVDDILIDNIPASLIPYEDTSTNLGTDNVQGAVEILDTEADRVSGESGGHSYTNYCCT